MTIFVCSCLCFGPLVGQGIGPAQRRQPSFLSPATSSSSLCHCATRGGAQSDARATFSWTAAIKKGLRVIDEGLWPHAGAVVSGHGPGDRTSYACTVLSVLVRQILFSVKSVYTEKSSTSGRSLGWGETLGGRGASPGHAGDARYGLQFKAAFSRTSLVPKIQAGRQTQQTNQREEPYCTAGRG